MTSFHAQTSATNRFDGDRRRIDFYEYIGNLYYYYYKFFFAIIVQTIVHDPLVFRTPRFGLKYLKYTPHAADAQQWLVRIYGNRIVGFFFNISPRATDNNLHGYYSNRKKRGGHVRNERNRRDHIIQTSS